jgi:predicted RNA polymerase sigma factor
MAARISRAKQRIRAAGSSFSLPAGAEREERLGVVLHVLYLIFNEGYIASSGSELDRVDLAREAIWLARMVRAQLPEDGEVTGALGPYQLQAAIAATHADAATAAETNWRQVHALYLILERIAPNPMVTLNRAIALAQTEGPRAGLALLSTLDGDERLAGHHRLQSVRAHLLEKAGDQAGAYEHYRRAAKATASIAEQRYLESRASRVSSG